MNLLSQISAGRLQVVAASGILVLLATLLACTSPSRAGSRFPVEGEVTLLIPGLHRIVVQHGPVQGWSPATNMEYPVKDQEDLERLKVGDHIQAIIVTDSGRFWLDEIEIRSGDRPTNVDEQP